MGIPIREHTLEAIEDRLNSMNTVLNKINYLESALNVTGFSFELKRFLWKTIILCKSNRLTYNNKRYNK